MFRRTILLAATVAITFASMPAHAVPMSPAASAVVGSDLVLAQNKSTSKKKKPTQQQEVNQSVESGTVPKRYKSSVPKEYHHLIPFAK